MTQVEAKCLGEAEVEDLDMSRREDHDVLGLQVPVDDSLGVGRGEAVGHLACVVDDEADVEFGWNASFLYHLNSQVQLLLEFNGERVFGGEESGHSTAVVAPGLKLAPMRDQNLKIGVGVGLPISDDKDFHALALFSVFYHF